MRTFIAVDHGSRYLSKFGDHHDTKLDADRNGCTILQGIDHEPFYVNFNTKQIIIFPLNVVKIIIVVTSSILNIVEYRITFYPQFVAL